MKHYKPVEETWRWKIKHLPKGKTMRQFADERRAIANAQLLQAQQLLGPNKPRRNWEEHSKPIQSIPRMSKLLREALAEGLATADPVTELYDEEVHRNFARKTHTRSKDPFWFEDDNMAKIHEGQ